MRFWRFWLLPAVLATTVWIHPAGADEPYLEFVSGLRQRGYYDFAEEYLTSLQEKPGVPQEVKAVVPYEIGITLRDSARRLLIPEEQRARLDEAQAAFERFVNDSKSHPLAGRANSERAKILVDKARVNIWDAEGTSDQAKQQTLRQESRKLLGDARKIFQTAVEQHRKNFESFPGYIPEEQRELRRQRSEAEAEHIQAQIDLAETVYWEAQTYPSTDAKRKELLTNAMLEFEKIHTAYRSMIGGLYARLWQGKCLEEMGAIGEALGIYGELLKHEGSSTSMVNLQAKARQFQLICYNRDEKKEYRLVNQLATEWLRDEQNRRAKFTETGKGIEWEQARALEQLGMDRTVPETERTAYLNQALGIARGLSRRTGPHKAPAAAMVARISKELGRDANDPTDFNTAYGRANELFKQAQEITEKIKAAQQAGKNDEARQHAEARKGVASEMTRLLDIALRYADDSTDDTLRRNAALFLAIGYLYQERQYDAAAVSQFFMRDPDAPQEQIGIAGQIALASLNDAYQYAEEGDRDFERDQILKLADSMATRFPESQLATGAHLSAARLFWDDKAYLQAAEAWMKVPQSAGEYGISRLKAGAAYLEHYAAQSQLPDGERPTAEQLNEWLTQAEQQLQAGVNAVAAKTPADSVDADLLRGKLALAQVRNLKGVYKTQGETAGAIELLTADPHALVKAVQVPQGQKRPDDPAQVTSRQFASAVYQQLLRAQIGVKNIEAARTAREQLEQVASGEDAAALTQVFVQFGQQLQQELEQLQASGSDERLADVRQGFEAFLNDLFARDQSQQTFSSLLWIAETYASLAEGSDDDLAKSTEYFQKAADAYQAVLTRAESDPAFLGDPKNELAVRIRLMESRMREKNFEAAEEELATILAEAPNAPNVQESGALLYERWGDSGVTAKYAIATNGNKEQKLWGWGELANRMKMQSGRPELRAIYFTASEHFARTLHRMAQNLSGEERKTALARAKLSLDTFARTTRDVPDDIWNRVDELYASILTDLGEPVAALQRPGAGGGMASSVGGAAAPGAAARPAAAATPGAAAAAEEPENPNRTGNIIVVSVLLALGIGAVVGVYYWTTQQAKKQRAAKLAALAASTPVKKKKPRPAESKKPSAS